MVEEFWIIDTSGICLFHRAIHEKSNIMDQKVEIQIDEQLFSGLLSGIMSFAEEVSKEQIKKIELDEGKFLFFARRNLIFIVRSHLNTSDKNVKKKIQIIEDLFIKKYSKELDTFNGDVSSFRFFENDLEEIFKKISKSEKWGKGLIDL
ncbi:MAG: hypothetical protein ACFFHV_13100 [Promethearchaeota archaeon]